MKKYRPTEIEPKWQKIWKEQGLHKTPGLDDARPKKYVLDMFPYPSGAGMHIGHIRNYSISDAVARYYRMRGHAILRATGWDAFGLPTEDFALKNKVSPQEVTKQNTDTFRRQLQQMGFAYDWDREINSSDPEFYKWTQWFFLLLYERNLAYKKAASVNWDPVAKTVLANEQVINGRAERSGAVVEKKILNQWFFKITDYADRLLDDLEDLDWPEKIKAMQRNWIGKSQGAEVDFVVEGAIHEPLTVYTTRIDTIYGATYLVVAPEHPLLDALTTDEQRSAVQAYVAATQARSEIERQEMNREKTGVFTGTYAINPGTKQPIPIWVADYVLMGYGTGAIMAVPAHDQRDYDFAQAFDLPVIEVVEPVTGVPQENPEFRRSIVAYVEDPATGDVLSINWGAKAGGSLLIGGGIDGDEDPVAAAVREVAEETGYTDVELVAQTGTIHHNYFAASKNVARRIEAVGIHLRLKSHAKDAAKLEADEQGKFTVEWLTKAQAVTQINDQLHALVLRRFADGQLYTGEGILTASGPYSGLHTAEARELMSGRREMPVLTDEPLEFGEPHVAAEARSTVSAVVTRPEDDKVMLIRWNEFGWLAPVVGGIDPGESPEEAAVRELLEETGYQARAVKKLGGEVVSHFYAQNKQVWRARHDQPVHLELTSDKPQVVKGDDVGKFEVVWLAPDEAIARMTHPENAIGIARYIGRPTLELAGARALDGGTPPSVGRAKTQYKMRDWLISRQRYWGAPIPIIHCAQCGEVPVPKEDLPVRLPELREYEPTGDGRSPLAGVTDWVNTECPVCGGPAERETDTMDGFACSSWYFLRYADPHNDKTFASREAIDRWLPVDVYVGGAEHAVLHLLYARMWTKVMFDAGLIGIQEPFMALRNQGMILAADGSKMSKSKGNVVNPDTVLEEGYGADALRLYELFIGPFDQGVAWNTRGIDGTKRFLNRVYTLVQEWSAAQGQANSEGDADAVTAVMHRTIKKVTIDMEAMGYNTAIAALMEAVNELYRLKERIALENSAWRDALRSLLQLLAPLAPHITDELWVELGEEKSVHLSNWPSWDEARIATTVATIVVQVNGKLRAQIECDPRATQEDAVAIAKRDENVQRHLGAGELKKVVYVPGRLINFVVAN